jgi:integrase
MGKLKTSFVLKQYSENEKQIILYANFGYKEYDVLKKKNYYKPLRYYTGLRIENHLWDKENKQPIEPKKQQELENIVNVLKDIFNYLSVGKEEITPYVLKSELEKKLGRRPKNQDDRINSKKSIHIANYIEEVLLKDQNGRTTVTLRSYKELKNKITSFEKKEGIILTTENFNEEVYLKFVEYLRKRLNKINSVWGEVKKLKAVLNEISRKYKISTFNPTTELANKDKVSATNEEKIYLDFNHIKKILDYEPKTESLKNTKFILLCLLFTGCRYSDVFQIKPDYTYEKDGLKFRYARYIDKKTGKDIIVPLLKPLEEVFRKSNDLPPYIISGQKFNDYVKDLAELSELKEEITLSYTNSYGKKEYEVKPFYKFVSSHIGRRSFITNLINHIPVTILGKITGHSLTNKNVIFTYNKISLLGNTVMFIKELKRLQENYNEEFIIDLI